MNGRNWTHSHGGDAGTENFGGALATAGGLVFCVGTTGDAYVAFALPKK